ncbi:MAG: aldehyde dehydrogenase family protein, partial [Rhodospirillales bacterium]|nr:aldehyde dehydrogenase family protein [Rhodospirillales bacterium]
MTKMIKCVSPIDGSVYAERPTLSLEQAQAAVARAKAAQLGWAARPLTERIALVSAGVERVGAMNDIIVEELAWQMGRPVRYGGEFGGFSERANYMADIAEDALAPIEISDDGNFKRYIKRIPHGAVFVVAPWNYPYMTAI